MNQAGDVTDDAILGGRLRLLQPRRGHRFGHDAVLLAAAVPAMAGEHAADFGAGVGAAGLVLAARVDGVRVTLIERDEALAALARENADRNGLSGRVGVASRDVASLAGATGGAGAGPFDHVLMNPPFNDETRHQSSPDRLRRDAHMGAHDTLTVWTAAATAVLRDGGALTLIYRAEGLEAVLSAMAAFEDIAVLLVRPKPGAPPIRVIVQGRCSGGFAPRVAATSPQQIADLILADEKGRPSEAAEDILRYAMPLDLHSRAKHAAP